MPDGSFIFVFAAIVYAWNLISRTLSCVLFENRWLSHVPGIASNDGSGQAHSKKISFGWLLILAINCCQTLHIRSISNRTPALTGGIAAAARPRAGGAVVPRGAGDGHVPELRGLAPSLAAATGGVFVCPCAPRLYLGQVGRFTPHPGGLKIIAGVGPRESTPQAKTLNAPCRFRCAASGQRPCIFVVVFVYFMCFVHVV